MRRKPFLLGSLVLLAGFLSLTVADNLRPWRRLQAEFLALERQRLQERLAAERSRAESEAEPLRAAVAAETERLESQRADVDRLEGEIRDFRGKLRKAERRRESARLALDEERRRAPAEPSPAMQALADELLEARIEVEEFREVVENRTQRLAELSAGLVEAREAWQRFMAPVAALEDRLAELERGAWLEGVPVLELFRPGIAVREVTLSAGPDGRPQVDRCATCHLGAVRGDLDGDAGPPAQTRQVFRSHPHPELYVGEASPHPYARFGCTTCHGGEGRATGFEWAGHEPYREAATQTILPASLVESSCVRCHGEAPGIAGLETAGAGRRLVSLAGCAGCHPPPRPGNGPPAFELPKPGPSLHGIAGKTRPAWAYRWIAAPRELRPTTQMPHLFDLETGAAAERARRRAEIRAIVEYLWERSRRDRYPSPPPGDAAAGRRLFDGIGCRACHLIAPDARRAEHSPGFRRLQGPPLAGIGGKVDAGWLFGWLRDPHQYRPDTPMPSLRLSDREAADLTAYLMGSVGPAVGEELPAIPAAVRDELVLAELRESLTVVASDARLDEMGARERDLFLGERAILRYGCHGCHDIPGFEDRPPPDRGSLVDLGRRLSLSRGLAGSAIHPQNGRGVPDYGWDRRQTDAVLIHLLGQGPPGLPELADRPELTAGREILERYGCRSCHRLGAGPDGPGLDGPGLDGPGLDGPPDLSFEGARVRSDWLFAYLQDPGRVDVRPWLEVRMPTFYWSDGAVDAVVRHFVERDGVSYFEGQPAKASARDLAVGRAVYRMLQCDRCHARVSDGDVVYPRTPAPAYEPAKERLRPSWVVSWILDPHRWDPDTPMPSYFRAGDGDAPDASFLVANLALPMFREERDRVERAFDSDVELERYFSDPRRVVRAVRDYLWWSGAATPGR